MSNNGAAPYMPPVNATLDAAIDAQAAMADAYIAASGALSAEVVAAGEAYMLYFGYSEDAVDTWERAKSYKIKQNPGVKRGLRDLIQAFSLKDMWNRISINLGGK